MGTLGQRDHVMHPSNVIAAAQQGEQVYDMNAGQNVTITGYDRLVNVIGFIVPDVPVWDRYAWDRLTAVSTNQMFLELGNSAPNNDITFRELEIDGVFGQGADVLILQRSAATFLTPGGVSEWEWPGLNRSFVSGNNYRVTFRR